jgi:DNA-binding MarR family transcriptional regulator
MIYEDMSWIFLEWRRYHQRRLRPFDVTIQQYSLMKSIARNDSMGANEAAEYLHCDRPTLSVIIANLVKKGWIERVPDKDDRRKCRLVVTECGLSELTRIDAAIEPVKERPFDCLTKEERRTLSRLLAAGRANLERLLDAETCGKE